MASSGAGQAPFVTNCDGPLNFIGRRDNSDRITPVNHLRYLPVRGAFWWGEAIDEPSRLGNPPQQGSQARFDFSDRLRSERQPLRRRGNP